MMACCRLWSGFTSMEAGRISRRGWKNYMGVFDTLNVDMIFNFPTQTEKILQRDLEIIDQLPVDQVTFYPLMASAATEKAIQKTLGKVDYGQEKRFYRQLLTFLSRNYTPGSAWCFSAKNR